MPLLEVLRRLGIPARPGVVKRAAISMGIIHGTFVVITGINIGVAQIVIPVLPPQIIRFAFAMMTLETMSWAYLIYWNGWVRNKLIGLVNTAHDDL